MPGKSSFTDQLFHTVTVRPRTPVPPHDLLASIRQGWIQLPPHPRTQIALPIDWSADPLGDHNWRFQFHSLVWLDQVREAAIKTDDRDMLTWYQETLESWILANPQDAPASDYSWFDMAVGLRVIVLAFALNQFGPQDWLLDAIQEHGKHLASESNYAHNGNHGLHQDMGLIVAGQALNNQAWIDLARDRIGTMLESAVDDEGVSREGSIDYQYRNYVWHREAVDRLVLAGVTGIDWMIERIDLMTHFLAHAVSPSGNYALIGDTQEHKVARLDGTLANWYYEPGAHPPEKAHIYKAGYLFARRRWLTFREDRNNAYLTQRFGPGRASAVHGHEDAGSVTLDAFDGPILVDSGLFAYEAGEARLYCRGRSSHNVIDVEGRFFYPSADCELLTSRVTERAIFTTIRAVGLKGVEWHRSMLWLPEENVLVVDDRVRLKPEDCVVQRWHLAPGTGLEIGLETEPTLDLVPGSRQSLDPRTKPVLARLASGVCAAFWPVGKTEAITVACGVTDPMQGWISRKFAELEPAPELEFKLTGKSVRLTTVLTYADVSGQLPVLVEGRRTSKNSIITIRRPDGTLLTTTMTSQAFDIAEQSQPPGSARRAKLSLPALKKPGRAS